jgi:eukaryotic-like serine/threonine-protein kinase
MATDLVGQVIDGKYRVDALVGRGGMGAVYRATQLSLDRPVAIKVIREDMLADESAVERFRREALAVARLRHPNVVVVHDFDVAPGVGAYIVMELLDGRSLRDELVSEGRVAPERASHLIRQACDGVQAAHAVGVIHRDLKPDNIFLAGETVKVLDFGVAKLADAESRAAITLPGAFVGTPAYAAPEHCLGGDSDARSDVYALGCVLYELVTGRPPFEAPSIVALLNRHVTSS